LSMVYVAKAGKMSESGFTGFEDFQDFGQGFVWYLDVLIGQ